MSNELQTRTPGTHQAVVAWLRLARIYHKIDRRSASTFSGHELSVSRFDVLNHAGTPQGRTQQDLAASLLVTKGNVTQLVDAMEREGLLKRKRDGRSKRIYLTDRGREIRSIAVAEQEAAIVDDFSALNEDEIETLVSLLRRLDRSLT